MQRLSPDSLLKSVGESSQSPNTALTPQHGSGQVGGLTNGTDAARAWLVVRTPEQVDQELETSLNSSLSVTLRKTREWRFPEGKPAYSLTTVTGAVGPSKENIERAIQRVEAATTPVTKRVAETMIAQLTAATAQRAETGAMSEIKLDLYVDCLLRHPADVATAAIRTLAIEPRAHGGTAWFPTLSELEGLCRQFSGERLSMVQGLRNWREPEPIDLEKQRLYDAWQAAVETARYYTRKVGPGPATDTGERGERLELERLALVEVERAKAEYHTYKKA